MTSKLGCHWQRTHPDQQDMPHIEAMQYKSVKLFKDSWDNAGFCADLLAVLPGDSYILARDHALSEQKEDMWRDPVAAGIDHANQWINKVRSGQYHLPTDRTFFLGINEPDATNGDRNKIDLYTESFLRHLQANGLRGGAFNFSTGHPRTVDGTPNTPADYSVFERSHRAIVEGHHIAVLHIYGTGAVPCAPGHFDRLKACDWLDVQWVVGEFGIDEHVIGGGEHAGFHDYFKGRLNDYCGWLDTAILGVNDSRIHSYQVFTYDFAHPWDSFDTHPIRPALESYPWRHMQVAPTFPAQPDTPPPFVTHLPSISNGAQTTPAYVKAPSGLNLRKAPNVSGDVITAIPYGDQVAVYPDDTGTDWRLVEYQGNSGYVYGYFLSDSKPDAPSEPAKPSAPQGDKWERAIDWVLRWEGGYQNNPVDHGNWTGGRQGVGENKGTNFGISAASYPNLDIKNLTREAAKDIYLRDYWIPSGAAAAPWPACLLLLDTAVLHGVGAAQRWQAETNGNPYAFAAKRLHKYTTLDNWHEFGAAWTNRTADLLEEMGK